MKTIRVIAILLLTAFVSMVFPQTNWELDGQIRHRIELDNRDFNSDTNINSYNLLRSRVGLSVEVSDSLSAYFQLQDSRRFGEEQSTLTDGSADNMDLHQAYVQIGHLFNLPVNVKLGRMEVIQGSQRFIGAVGWHNIGRSFDGVIFKWFNGKNYLDVFAFQEVESNAAENDGDKGVYGLNGNFLLNPDVTLQPFFIWQRTNPNDDLNRFTTGVYVKGKAAGQLAYEADFAYQGGTLANQDVTATLAAANVSYTFKSRAKPALKVGVDFVSGDDDFSDEKVKAFDTMYATNHKFYGFMDYFLNLPVNTLGRGLIDSYVNVSISPKQKSRLQVIFHRLAAHQDFVTDSGETASLFGNEIDLIYSLKYSKNISLTGGFAIFSPGEIFKQTRGEDTSTWAFVMTTVRL